MKNLLGNSAMPNYVKLTATGILGLTYLSALGVAVHDYLVFGSNAPIPGVVNFVLGTGLSMALTALGMHQGAQLQAPAAGNGGGGTNASAT